MNRYDKEETIIGDFQELSTREVLFFPKSFKAISIFYSVHSKWKWRKWINSSSKKELPPDFYNPRLKLMMDVMRIDDHAYVDKNGKVVNPHNKRESELVKELIRKNESFKLVAEQGNLFITPDSGLRGYQDHNYDYYINTFKRVVGKHIKKIDNYKKNHPGFKTIFFVVDESSPYFKCFDKNRPRKVGERFYGEPHFWWIDKNMVNCLKESDVDYLIWMAPYKYFHSEERVMLPHIIVMDVKKIDYDELLKYDASDMQSAEI